MKVDQVWSDLREDTLMSHVEQYPMVFRRRPDARFHYDLSSRMDPKIVKLPYA